MAEFPRSRRVFWWLLVPLLVIAVWALQEFRLFERAWFALHEDKYASQWQERSLWLPDYQVQVEAQPIVGLEGEVSALTYDPDRRSLFTVTNRNPEIIELSLDGQILRRIALRGFGDPEAIEYIAPGRYVISDERLHRLILVQLDDDTLEVEASQGQQLSLGIGLSGNKGFEGLAYDSQGQRLFVAKERDPVRIYEIKGFPYLAQDKPMTVQVADDVKRDARLFVRDLSSLDFDAGSGHLLVLSDESRLILELNAAGKPISTLSLRKGAHGLHRSVPQAEGLATDDAGTLYLVSEPNLFYRFSKRPPSAQ